MPTVPCSVHSPQPRIVSRSTILPGLEPPVQSSRLPWPDAPDTTRVFSPCQRHGFVASLSRFVPIRLVLVFVLRSLKTLFSSLSLSLVCLCLSSYARLCLNSLVY